MWPSNPTLGYISGQNFPWKRHMHTHVHCSTIHHSQDMETTQMSTDRWFHSEEVVYIHNGILLSHKIEQNNAICSNIDGTRDSHTEWSKSEREKQIPYDITYIRNLIYGTNEPFHRKENHGLGEQTCGCQGGGGGSGVYWELGVNRCKLLPLERISNEILLCSTGNYV